MPDHVSEASPGLSGAAYLRLIALGAMIGVPAALVAAAFLALVHQAEQWLWTDLPAALGASSPPWYLVLGLPVVGALIVFAARTLLPGDGGHSPLGGLSSAPMPWTYGPGVALAALGTLPFGAVLGPEAPLIALGSVVGSALTVWAKPDQPSTAILTTAGSFSAVSAVFGGPLVAGLLMVEAGVALGAQLVPVLLPGLVAAAVGYLLFIGLGDWGGLSSTPLSVPDLPPYEGTSLRDLGIALVIGVLAALVTAAVRRLAGWVDALGTGRVPMPWLLVAGAAVVGLVALAARALGADSQDVLFSGQASIPVLVEEPSVQIVLILLVAKGIGYAVSMGAGFRGGPVFPAIFLGIALGAIAQDLFGVSPTLAVAVGAAAGMAAMTGLLFAALLFAALLVGSDGLDTIPAAVLAATAAWITSKALTRRSADAPGNPA